MKNACQQKNIKELIYNWTFCTRFLSHKTNSYDRIISSSKYLDQNILIKSCHRQNNIYLIQQKKRIIYLKIKYLPLSFSTFFNQNKKEKFFNLVIGHAIGYFQKKHYAWIPASCLRGHYSLHHQSPHQLCYYRHHHHFHNHQYRPTVLI